jgi:NADH:ubiquinone oxidoreductase subunit E
MSYYAKHVFFCCNKREAPEKCCADSGAMDMQQYAKGRIKALGLNGPGHVRINKAGCLDRCEEGPVLVVYPTPSGTPTSTVTISTRSSTAT